MGVTFKDARKKDRECVCIRCGEEYVYSVKEQELFEEKGYKPPKRCKVCRGYHKREMEILNINGRGKYYGLGTMLPGMYKGNFKGGTDVTDISGRKYRCTSYYWF